MDPRTRKYLLIVAFIVLAIGWVKRGHKIEEQAALIDEYSSALEQANYNIEDANSSIEDAQSAAWSTYEDMGYALDNLETVDTVSDPQ